MTRVRSSLALVVPLFSLLALSACSGQPAPEFRINATIKDLMDAIMDPNADALWDSVVVDATLAGVTKKEPKTDDDWKALKRNAIALTEISNLLLMEGRHVAKPGEKAEDERVDLNPEEIEARINSDRASWTKFAHGLQDAALVNLRAIEARDLEKFLDAGDTLDRACESCHRQYWYRVPPPVDALTP
jgi:hypothetical protein